MYIFFHSYKPKYEKKIKAQSDLSNTYTKNYEIVGETGYTRLKSGGAKRPPSTLPRFADQCEYLSAFFVYAVCSNYRTKCMVQKQNIGLTK